MSELLLELFSEEIPAKMQLSAAQQLKETVIAALDKSAVSYTTVKTFVTPRRLTLTIEGLPLVQGDSVNERKGPRVDAPEAAIEGFLRSTGLRKEQLTVEHTAKGDFYMAVIKQRGQKTNEVLTAIIQETLNNFHWPKSMRWGSNTLRWVRPLHRIICIFNQEILPVTIGHIQASNVTEGHRFLANDNHITVHSIIEYKKKLEDQYVVLDSETRMQKILEQAMALSEPLGLGIRQDAGLLQEIVGLVEYPVVLLGKFDRRFMSIPKEALISVMRTHQKYLSLQNNRGELVPYFIAVSNIKTADEGKKITEGFERVLTARLEDARFFWDKDRAGKLASRVAALKNVIFHAKLGTLEQKVQRMIGLTKFITPYIPQANSAQAERAAMLCKADLVTQMVGEFPELQGIMGYYYALENKEDKEIAEAIREHYLPQGPSDVVPSHPISIITALSDKVDTLTGLFAVGEIPTGSKDPFALRRAALGIIRILLKNHIHIPLRTLLDKSLSLYPSSIIQTKEKNLLKLVLKGNQRKDVVSTILGFMEERLRVILKEQSISHDLIMAVFDGGAEDDFVRLRIRVLALQEFLATKKGNDLLSAYRRATNIVAAEEKKDKATYTGTPKEDLFEQEQEHILYSGYKTIGPILDKALANNDFTLIMQELSHLHGPINDFFEHVTVNSDKSALRKNRLLLLSKFRELLHHVANFSLIPAQS